jgi:membrane protein required for colicin V production
MFIDIVVLLAVVMALFKGYSKGFIMALVNTLSLIIGLAAAVKFSSVISPIVAEKTGSGQYTPIVSFALVYLAVIIVIRLLGKAIEKTLETVKIGFVNRMGGVVLYLLLYVSVVSILVFYLEKMGIFTPDLVEQSVTYAYIAAFGPTILDGIGYLIPFFRDMFDQLNDFFDEVHIINKGQE